jgi:molybdopterin molybdotransferase
MNDSPLMPVAEALERILADFKPLESEPVDLFQAAGRILAVDVRSEFDLPPFNNASMDGFALHSADRPTEEKSNAVTLKVVADIPAGIQPALALKPGQAARIMTGAPLPEDADCVVPVEDTNFPYRETRELPGEVTVYRFPPAGANVRPRGQDAAANQVLLQAGTALTPAAVALLASLGYPKILVHCRPRVAILSTGDELLKPGTPLQPGKIYESNSLMVAALVAQAGGVSVHLGIAADRAEAIRQKLDLALDIGADLILTSAGVSVGVYDYVRQVIEENGNLSLWRVNMRPGKPLAFGRYKSTPVIGLPGNPVSAFVGGMVFVLPVLQRLQGQTPRPRSIQKAVITQPIHSDGRESYLRAEVRDEGNGLTARLVAHQGSGNLISIVRANALLIIPAGVTSLSAGSVVDVWLVDSILKSEEEAE